MITIQSISLTTITESLFILLTLVIWALVVFFSLISIIVVPFRYYKDKHTPKLPKNPPGVSILRPLCGVDVNLYSNLESSFKQDYPKLEIIFLVKDPNDPAIHVVHLLKKAYPHIDSTLIIGNNGVGINPKVNNLSKGYKVAKYDIVWIIDSNVSVDSGCCARSVATLSAPGVGLVHHLPCGVDPHSFGSRLEMAFLNCVHARMYVAINWLGPASCINGKSNLFRKSDLSKVGGIENFGRYMSEDNFIGKALWGLGLKHRMTADVALQSLGSNSITDYFARRARWGRIRKYAVPLATIVEPLTESITLGFAIAYSLNRILGLNPVTVFVTHIAYWVLVDFIIMATLAPKEARSWRFWCAYLFREISACSLYCFFMAGSRVEWRGKVFQLLSDGTVVLKPLTKKKDEVQKEVYKFKENQAKQKVSTEERLRVATTSSKDTTKKVSIAKSGRNERQPLGLSNNNNTNTTSNSIHVR